MAKHHVVSNRRMVNRHHDPSIDDAVISEFTRRFPALTFLSFFRHGGLHVVDFVGQHADLIAAGIPLRADVKRCAGDPDQFWWLVTRDRRRKAGALVAEVRIENGTLPSDHPMAWLEPQRWMPRSIRDLDPKYAAELADIAGKWDSLDEATRQRWMRQFRHKVANAIEHGYSACFSGSMKRDTTTARILRHERFECIPVRAQSQRRGPLPRSVAYFKRTPRLRVGAMVEIVGLSKVPRNNGKYARIIGFDYSDDHRVEVESIDGPLARNDGSTALRVWMKPANLRRLWTGLNENDRTQLRLWRTAS